MNKVELEVVALAPATGPQYVIVMQEVGGLRRLPIVIGLPEAQAIAMEIERVTRPRPMTHDLFVNTLSAFGIDLNEILITKIDQDGVFHSELVCEQAGTHTKIRIDSRTSDAIALALRFKCKIYAFEEILQAASFSVEDLDKNKSEKKTEQKLEQKIAILENKLEQAIKNENYELAAQIKKDLSDLKDSKQ